MSKITFTIVLAPHGSLHEVTYEKTDLVKVLDEKVKEIFSTKEYVILKPNGVSVDDVSPDGKLTFEEFGITDGSKLLLVEKTNVKYVEFSASDTKRGRIAQIFPGLTIGQLKSQIEDVHVHPVAIQRIIVAGDVKPDDYVIGDSELPYDGFHLCVCGC